MLSAAFRGDQPAASVMFQPALDDSPAEPNPPTGAPAAPTGQRMMLVAVGDHHFALPIGSVREILGVRPCTPLPGGGRHVRGLINVRGRIVTVLDMGARLGLAPAPATAEQGVVLVESAGRTVGLAVDAVEQIAAVDPAAMDDSAGALRALGLERPYLRGVGEIDGHLFVALDVDAFLAPLLA